MTHAFAVTRPVNPPGVEPAITEEQLWKGLEFRVHNPAAFVPMISSSKTTFDEGKKELTLANSGQVIEQNVEAHAATIMYFELSTGTRITNVISHGPDDEIFLTQSFANGLPGVPGDKPKPSAKELNAAIGKVVDKSIGIIRQMVKDGEL
ncbi:DUF1857-domain-containing protein [Mycena vulgaris]|nr:DUF1857-domain-containing protein [Mycena vulgaris]